MHPVNPLPGEISQCGEVLASGKELSLEASHLAGGCSGFRNGTTADNPAHRRITTQAVGVVHVLVTTKAAEDGLPEQALHRVLSVLARARINEFIAGHDSQTEGFIEFAIGQQSGVGRDAGTVELKLQAAVEIDPQWLAFGITRRGHGSCPLL